MAKRKAPNYLLYAAGAILALLAAYFLLGQFAGKTPVLGVMCPLGMKFMPAQLQGYEFCYAPSSTDGAPCSRNSDCMKGSCIIWPRGSQPLCHDYGHPSLCGCSVDTPDSCMCQ